MNILTKWWFWPLIIVVGIVLYFLYRITFVGVK